MLGWVFGVEIGLSGGGLLSPTCVNLLKKFGTCKTSWEFYENVIFWAHFDHPDSNLTSVCSRKFAFLSYKFSVFSYLQL